MSSYRPANEGHCEFEDFPFTPPRRLRNISLSAIACARTAQVGRKRYANAQRLADLKQLRRSLPLAEAAVIDVVVIVDVIASRPRHTADVAVSCRRMSQLEPTSLTEAENFGGRRDG